MQAIRRIIAVMTSRNDIVLAAIIIAILFMMILPLPTLVMDILIGSNITAACVLLMVAIYLPSPLAFSSFPAVLLVSTLFRLGISISTTRLILLDGYAGNIIETFGNFVVGGNLVVGLVVFMILAIVQFIVITKGSERVAEVAARFSLDGMPGKQMSIDADLRANAINMDEARRRRSLVEKESQMYGAMDGAMKFVKGDAIAGLIIIAVNLLGGLLIGTLQRGMSASEAATTYSILSVGDGLIAQIPALLTAICAGIIVTRVPTDDQRASNVGTDIGAQVLAHPRALIIAAVIATGTALIPGMPTLVFLSLAAAIGTTGFVLLKGGLNGRKSAGGASTAGHDFDAQSGAPLPEQNEPVPFASAPALTIEVSPTLFDPPDIEALKSEFPAVRYAFYQDLGISLPPIQFRTSKNLAENTYQVLLFEVPVAEGRIPANAVLARESQDHLDALEIPYDSRTSELEGEPAFWVNSTYASGLTHAGVPFLHANQVPNWHLSILLHKHAGEFLGIQETRQLLSAMEESFAELVKEAHRVMPIQKIAEILQRLVSEDISIRDMRAILEALVEWAQKEKDSVLLTEYVRGALKRYISYKYSNAQNFLPAYLLAPNVEDMIRNAVRQTASGSYLALEPEKSQALLEQVQRTVGNLKTTVSRPVLLTSMDIRRYVRRLIEQEFYHLPVLSYQELTAEVNVQPLARIEL